MFGSHQPNLFSIMMRATSFEASNLVGFSLAVNHVDADWALCSGSAWLRRAQLDCQPAISTTAKSADSDHPAPRHCSNKALKYRLLKSSKLQSTSILLCFEYIMIGMPVIYCYKQKTRYSIKLLCITNIWTRAEHGVLKSAQKHKSSGHLSTWCTQRSKVRAAWI